MTGQGPLTFKGRSQFDEAITSVAFSPDGRRIVSGSGDHTVTVWDTTTGKKTLTLKGHSEAVFGVSLSPDGRQIVSGGFDKTVRVWDATTGQETLTLTGHSGRVL